MKPEVFRCPKGILIEIFLGAAINFGGAVGEQFNNDVGIFALLDPQQPAAARSVVCPQHDKEVGAAKVLGGEFVGVVVDGQIASGVEVGAIAPPPLKTGQ